MGARKVNQGIHEVTDIKENKLTRLQLGTDKCIMVEKWGLTFFMVLKHTAVQGAQFFQVFGTMLGDVKESTYFRWELETSNVMISGKIHSIDEDKASIYAMGNASLITLVNIELEFKVRITNEKLEAFEKDQNDESGVEDDD